MPHKSRKISREGARQKIEGAAVENRRLTFLSVPPFCHQGDCMLLHRESLRGSSVICEGVSCAWTVINARIQNKSTHGPRILMNVARVETNTVRIRGVALASRGNSSLLLWWLPRPNVFIDYELNCFGTRSKRSRNIWPSKRFDGTSYFTMGNGLKNWNGFL